jgi:hypothetical protein
VELPANRATEGDGDVVAHFRAAPDCCNSV